MVAALAAAVAMIEPHLGLPAMLALFCWVPQTRRTLLAAGIALGFVSFALFGFASNSAYVTHVLPGQAISELPASDQFSLSHLLYVAGFADPLALALGFMSYVCVNVLGIWLAGRASRALGSVALVVTVAPAIALWGGSYLHEPQLAAALPAALLLAARARQLRSGAWLALSLLVFPWFTLSTQTHAIAFALYGVALVALVWAALLASTGRTSRSRAGYAAVATVGFVVLILTFRHLPGASAASLSATTLPPSVLDSGADASANWGAYLRTQKALTEPTIRGEAEKIPASLALVLIGLSAALALRRRETLARSTASDFVLQPIGSERGT